MPRSRHRQPPDTPARSPLLTPMIDVMMCLLIVFMVIQPGMRRGLDLQVPPVKAGTSPPTPTDRIVLHVSPGPAYTLNGEPVAPGALEATLRGLFTSRVRRVLFVQGDGPVRFGDVIGAVDLARAAGVEVVGLVPRPDTARQGADPQVRPVAPGYDPSKPAKGRAP